MYFDSGIEIGRLVLLVAALLLIFGFEFVNGFHDTANAVATVIYTRSLKPWPAVVLSGICNFAGVYLGGIAVAMAIIKLLPVELMAASGSGAGLAMMLAILIAAIIWNIATWYFGLPASSSHTLIGAIVGVGLANSLRPGHVFGSGVNWHKVQEIGFSLVASPLFGLLLAGALLLGLSKVLRSKVLFEPARTDKLPPWWVRLTLIGTCSGVSFAHGANDGQKGVGLVLLLLVGVLPLDFALNRSLDAERAERCKAAIEEIQKTVGAAYGGQTERRATAGSAPVAESAISQVLGDLAWVKSAIGERQSVIAIEPKQRWEMRTRILRIDNNLSLLAKQQPDALAAADAAQLEHNRAELRDLVDYAPFWVLLGVALALGCGTMIGWKRIVVTVGEKIGKTHMSYAQGASAEIVAAGTIGATAYFGLPVSTTHVLSSGVAGTMLAGRSGLQGSTVRNIALAWLLTLPAAVLLSGALFLSFSALLADGPDARASGSSRADLTLNSQDPDATPALQVISATPLRLSGSGTIGAELMPDLAEAFLAKRNGASIVRSAGTGPRASWVVSARLPGQKVPVVFEIETAGSATAFESLAAKTADVGMSVRRATRDEAAMLATAGLGELFSPGSEHEIGLDAVVVIVHPGNPIRSLRLSELGQIFSGETRKWPHEAAALGEVTLYARNEGTTLDLFRGVVLGGRSLAPAKRFADNSGVSDAVLKDERGIGFVRMGKAKQARVVAISADGETARPPTPATVASGAYPLVRRLYLYTTSATNHPLANDFIAFALSPEGQALVASNGFVPIASATNLRHPR